MQAFLELSELDHLKSEKLFFIRNVQAYFTATKVMTSCLSVTKIKLKPRKRKPRFTTML